MTQQHQHTALHCENGNTQRPPAGWAGWLWSSLLEESGWKQQNTQRYATQHDPWMLLRQVS